MKEAMLFFLIFDFTATNSPNIQLLIIARDEKPVENVADVCIATRTNQYPRYTQLCKVYHFLKPFRQNESYSPHRQVKSYQFFSKGCAILPHGFTFVDSLLLATTF